MEIQKATQHNLTETLNWLEDEYNDDEGRCFFYRHKEMIVEAQKEGCLHCVILDSKAVGFVSSRLLGQLTYDTSAWIDLIAIHPDYRKKGIGTFIVRKTVNRLFNSGAKKITLQGGFTTGFWVKFGFIISEQNNQQPTIHLTLTPSQYKK